MSKQSLGKLGEQIASRFLIKKGYKILECNYRKFHGEIDIICEDVNEIVFVEVKTITVDLIGDVTRETYRPEFNMDKRKFENVKRTAELYIMDKSVLKNWRIDLMAVNIDTESMKSTIRHIKSVWT